MARLFAADSDSDESNNLPDVDCLDCGTETDVVSGGHVHPVTLLGTSYLYKSPLSALTLDIEHRPEKACSSFLHYRAQYSKIILQFKRECISTQGLSFQVWPSSLSLAKLAELQHIRRPQSWQVPVLYYCLTQICTSCVWNKYMHEGDTRECGCWSWGADAAWWGSALPHAALMSC